MHALGLGSTEGQSRVIYDFRDIVAKKEEPAVLREYHTRRVDESLQRIAPLDGRPLRGAGRRLDRAGRRRRS